MKITVWDDDPAAAGRWKEQLEIVLQAKGTSIEAPEPGEIEETLYTLHEYRREYLESDGGPIANEKSSLDNTDVLLVDNDLFELPGLKDYSAETVAARASLYTACGCIVVLNLSPDLDFDLTLLGHPSSKADLHINDRFVADPGLWEECPRVDGGFRPWHWPLLLRSAAMYRTRVSELAEAFESGVTGEPILNYFGFEQWSRRRLSRAARAFLHPEIATDQVSFSQFVQDNVSAVNVQDGKCIARRDDLVKLARVCARRIGKWLERYVLGPQDVLLDFPHLIEKMPFSIPDREQRNVDFWNSFAKLEESPIEVLEGLGIRPFDKGNWFDRPVFWAQGAESDENLERLLGVEDVNPCEFVFCEDASSFHRAKDCDQFIAAHNTVSDNRFVRWFGKEEGEELRYGPQSRLAM